MKIQPVAGPGQIQDKSTPEHVRTAKAINAFKAGSSSYDKPGVTQGSQPAVQNQNAIPVEELSAIHNNITEIEEPTVQEQIEQVKEEQKTKEDPALSRQFAQLARQEKALRAKAQQQEQAFKAKEQALAAREAQLAAQAPDLSKYVAKDKLKSDFLSVAAETGLSYDEISQQFLNQQPRDPRIDATISELKQQIQELKQARDNDTKSQTEDQQRQYQAAVDQIKVDVKKLVNSDPNFETIKATGSTKDVVDLITETFNKDGILLSVEEAAQQVEDYLVEEYMKATKISKIQKRMQSQAQTASPVAKPQQVQTQQQQPMKTLTNASASSRQLTARERALLAFKGELKS